MSRRCMGHFPHRSPCGTACLKAGGDSAFALVGRRTSRPVGRVLCARLRGPTVIHLGLPLPAASCGPPASIGRATLKRSRRRRGRNRGALLTLLRVGFTEPPGSLRALVVSYTTLPYGARTFLDAPRRQRRDRPADSSATSPGYSVSRLPGG